MAYLDGEDGHVQCAHDNGKGGNILESIIVGEPDDSEVAYCAVEERRQPFIVWKETIKHT